MALLKDIQPDERGIKHMTYIQEVIRNDFDDKGNLIGSLIRAPHPETGVVEEHYFPVLRVPEMTAANPENAMDT